jgi:hypothetical protein
MAPKRAKVTRPKIMGYFLACRKSQAAFKLSLFKLLMIASQKGKKKKCESLKFVKLFD